MKNNIREFPAKWSILVWTMTLIIGLLVFGILPFICVKHYIQSTAHNDTQTMSLIFVSILIPMIFVLAIFLAPRKYVITDLDIIVNRFGPNIIIPIRDINNIQHIARRKLKLVIRLFGVGGFWGWYGVYYSLGIGIFKMHTTNTKKLVLVECNNSKKILLSPEYPEDFVNTTTEIQSTLSICR